MSRLSLLSTKKLDPEVITQVAEYGFQLREIELITTLAITDETTKTSVTYALLKDNMPIVFTSARAVSALDGIPYQQNFERAVFCLSGKTGEEVKKRPGLGQVQLEATHAAALAEKIINSHAEQVVFFCGDQRRPELPNLLAMKGVEVQEVVVYKTVLQPVAVNETFDGILFFSPSAVQSFFTSNHLAPETICFATGNTTAAALLQATTNTVVVSEATGQENMIQKVKEYFKQL